MKLFTLVLAASSAAFTATAARADHTAISVGVGVNFGAPTYVAAPVNYPPPTTIVAPVSNYGYAPASGHWENVTVKTWIPGRWVTSRDRWGRPNRFFEEGRYAFRTERVWVEARRDGRHGDGRDNGYNGNGDYRNTWNR